MYSIRIGQRLLDLSTPKVMGILNLTPDSFFGSSRVQSDVALLNQAQHMLEQGADLLDLGAVSTRPGSEEVSLEEEWQRLSSGLRSVRNEFPQAIISVDTFRSEIAQRSLEEGAQIINDVSGLQADPSMLKVIQHYHCPIVLMHMRGAPNKMLEQLQYDDLMAELIAYFSQRIECALEDGVCELILDPGFGFSKTLEHNYQLLHDLKSLTLFDRPLLVGVSRKSMIWKLLNVSADEALNGSTAVHMLALQNGASILRVHDVQEAKQAIQIYSIYNKKGRK